MADIWEPYEKVKNNLKKYQFKHLGMDVFDPNYRVKPLAIFWCINSVWLLFVHGFSFKILFGQMQEFCVCFLTLSPVMLITIRFYYYIFHHGNFLELFETIKKIYVEFMDEEVEEKQLFKKYGLWILKLSNGAIILFISNCVCTVTVPILVFLVTGELHLPFGVLLPGFDRKTNIGYAVNYIYSLFQAYFCVISYSPIYSLFTIYVGSACYQVEAIIIKIKRFDEKLREKEMVEDEPAPKGTIKQVKPMPEPDKKPKLDAMSELKCLIKLHQNFLGYIGDVDTLYSLQIFFEFFSVGSQMVISLYVVTIEFCGTAYLIIVCAAIPIFIQCLFGVILEIKCENLMKQIYEVQWHLLEPRERRIFALFLLGAQQTQLLTCAGYVPLNLETFAKAYNFCYSFLMFLLNRHKAHSGGQ